MILIGQYDSPFVRRVGIALTIYGLAFEHRPWSTFSDADKIAPFNPLRRVPTLVLDDGEVLIETLAILDHLDEIAGPERALIAARGDARRRDLQTSVLAGGMADKAVALIYERVMHDAVSPQWARRCESQVRAALEVLEAGCAALPSPFFFGETPGHADIALACSLRFIREAHGSLFEIDYRPALSALANRCEALEPFRAVTQEFIPPA